MTKQRKENVMPKWTLKRLRMVGGSPSLVPLTKDEQDSYKDLLRHAAESQCTSPIYSGYHVRGCIRIPGMGAHTPQCGNIEYGHFQALHNEEAAVAALASRFNASTHREPPVLTIVAGRGKGGLKNLTMPCGNCRDILRDTVGEHCTIVSGNTDGGVAVVAELADALFDCYRPVPLGEVDVMSDVIHRLMRDGGRLAKKPHHASDKAPLRNYFASLTTGRGVVIDGPYVGAIQVGADYHPIYPAEVALIGMEFARDPYIRSVMIVAEGDGSAPPDVMYRDRQSLLNAAIEREHLTGTRYDPPVRLFTVSNGAVTGAWKTTVEESLPLPFSSRNFGDESVAQDAAYFRKRHGLD